MEEFDYEGFSLKLAIWDMFPVLLFCGSTVFIASVFRSAIFAVGAGICIFSGVCKVLWKFLLAIRHKNVYWLSKQMRFFMPTGFLAMLLALFVDRRLIQWKLVWKFLSVPYVYGLFLVGFAGMAAMLALSAKMDQKKAGNNKIEQSVNLVTQFILFLAVGQVCYFGHFYKAIDVDDYLISNPEVTVTELKNGWFFDGPGEGKALIFYPGAKVETAAYAPLMHILASQEGIDCFLVDMPCYFALYGMNRADGIMKNYSYNQWYLAGHSLGGTAANYYAAKHEEDVDGLILLGSYVSKDLSEKRFPLLLLYGSEDLVMNRNNLEKGMQMVPKDWAEVVIQGGNHGLFGSYGWQRGDGQATISSTQQWEETARVIDDWMMDNDN